MNTRFDYEYIRNKDVVGWRVHWLGLLSGRWIVVNDELVEDQNAKIFRFGFTVAEVAAAIGHSGYTDCELAWYQGQPDRYQLVDGHYVQVAGWAAAKAIADAELAALEQRGLDINAAREDSGLRQYTVAQAQTYINNKLNAATTVATMKEAVRDILLKMVPYVL